MFVRKAVVVDDGSDIRSASVGVPITRDDPAHLPQAFGTHPTKTGPYPTPWHQYARPPCQSKDDSLSFGGYSGVNFLQRNVRKRGGVAQSAFSGHRPVAPTIYDDQRRLVVG